MSTNNNGGYRVVRAREKVRRKGKKVVASSARVVFCERVSMVSGHFLC